MLVRARILSQTTNGDIELGPETRMVLPPHTRHAAAVRQGTATAGDLESTPRHDG